MSDLYLGIRLTQTCYHFHWSCLYEDPFSLVKYGVKKKEGKPSWTSVHSSQEFQVSFAHYPLERINKVIFECQRDIVLDTFVSTIKQRPSDCFFGVFCWHSCWCLIKMWFPLFPWPPRGPLSGCCACRPRPIDQRHTGLCIEVVSEAADAISTFVNYLHSVPQIWSIVNWASELFGRKTKTLWN